MTHLLPEGEFYVVSNYGWGDGRCIGPFNAEEALRNYLSTRNEAMDESDPAKQFKTALNDGWGYLPIHYITSHDKSYLFNYMES